VKAKLPAKVLLREPMAEAERRAVIQELILDAHANKSDVPAIENDGFPIFPAG
jgi:hypothetical protein